MRLGVAVVGVLLLAGCTAPQTGNPAACAEVAKVARDVANPVGPGDGVYPPIRGPLERAYDASTGDVHAVLATLVESLPDPDYAIFGYEHADEFATNLAAVTAACGIS